MPWWSGAACLWALLFAAPHFYWAAGDRGALSAQTAAADQAHEQRWFSPTTYWWGSCPSAEPSSPPIWLGRTVRTGFDAFFAAAWVACVVLALRGAVGVAALSFDVARGTLNLPFVLGGVAFGGLAAISRTAD